MEDSQIKDFYEAITSCRGNITSIASLMGMTRSRVKMYIESKPLLVERLAEVRNEVVDAAEENVFNAAVAGDLSMCKFVLTTIGKERGYTSGTMHLGKDGSATEAPVGIIDDLFKRITKTIESKTSESE